jgi:hypothetical protein
MRMSRVTDNGIRLDNVINSLVVSGLTVGGTLCVATLGGTPSAASSSPARTCFSC